MLHINNFITRWSAASGSERANYQLFLTELTALFALPRPEPASDDLRDNAYVFERRVDIPHADGSVTKGFIDLYRRGCFILEAVGHAPQRVAHFLMRALFTMFAEDVGLLPALDGKGALTSLLENLRDKPAHFAPALQSLWHTMNHGGFDARLMEHIRRFNGGLFSAPDVIPLDRDQIELLLQAAIADWRFVEPAIFGTLLERALEPSERHKLGAHYTPRAYVERLVLPTLVEPLRAQWQTTQIAVQALLQQGKTSDALGELRQFHYQLCQTRVLDPACGSGNFLYVALEHMKRLEGEVLNLIADLSKGQASFDTAGLTVDPHQFLGLEINPRAAAIAEIVLWIGYLQWHYRIHKTLQSLPDPVLRDFHNIEHRDALIAYDAVEYVTDEVGKALTRWDGVTYKTSPITGENIPDDAARVPIERYRNPRKAEWPQADYIVGNPPFIGASTMRRALGDGYVDALRATWPEVPESADFVMHWWHIAAEAVRAGQARQFGFITTNSIKQTFNRRVVEAQLTPSPQPSPAKGEGAKPLALAFAIPDHPWVDAADGAAVRIAMTVVFLPSPLAGEGLGERGMGKLLSVTAERETGEDAADVSLSSREGIIYADLSIGANVAGAVALEANQRLSSRGVMLFGAGFIVTHEEAFTLGLGRDEGVAQHIRAYRNGRDLTDKPRGVMVIDLFGLAAEEFRNRYPALYQWVLERVKPERDQNRDKGIRENWWIHGRPRPELRSYVVGLLRYIATVETAKHRVFQFLDADILPDNMLVNIAVDDAFHLGVLSSRIHVVWALAVGGTLENRPRYNKTRCFETFPFPEAAPEQTALIRSLAEQIDTHRKRVLLPSPLAGEGLGERGQAAGLTLTGLYNVLEKLRAGETLTAKDKAIHQAGLVSVLKTLHDELDVAVFAAYGWDDLAEKLVGQPGATTPLPDKSPEQAEAEEELLTRLAALNAQRAAEEAQGTVRWLRPDYQDPQGSHDTAHAQTEADFGGAEETTTVPSSAAAAVQDWPKELREQIRLTRALLAPHPQTAVQLAARFKRKPLKAVQTVLEALEGLGLAKQDATGWRA